MRKILRFFVSKLFRINPSTKGMESTLIKRQAVSECVVPFQCVAVASKPTSTAPLDLDFGQPLHMHCIMVTPFQQRFWTTTSLNDI